jgi:hypothetical protein
MRSWRLHRLRLYRFEPVRLAETMNDAVAGKATRAGMDRSPGARVMEGSSEYVLVEGTGATFDALRDVLRERRLPVVEEDPWRRRLAFRPGRAEHGGQIKALCAIFDVGHGLSKLVVVCVDETDGSVVAPDDSLPGLFMQVEHTLHSTWGWTRGFALPPAVRAEKALHAERGSGESN